MHDGLNDEALMLAYRAGDGAAFEALYRRWRRRLYGYFSRQCGSAALADELFQDVWLRVVKARAGYEVSAKFSTWLFRIAHNRLVDHYRAEGRVEFVQPRGGEDEEEAPDDWLARLPAAEAEQPQRRLERKQQVSRLAALVEALPAVQRETLLMSLDGELTLEEIAAACAVGRETAKSRLRYALNKLRSALKDTP